jgi:uncharacterized membrane protein
MNKQQFIMELRNSLKSFSLEEVKKIIDYYEELIEEKKEEGLKEEEIINDFGDIKSIVHAVTADLMIERTNTYESNENKVNKTNNVKNFFIILGICASPILLPLGIGFFAIFLSLAVVFISLIFSFGVTAIVLLAMIIPGVIQVVASGAGSAYIIIYISGMLLGSGIMILLTIGTIHLGKYLLNLIIKAFSKAVKKRTKGEIK